MLSDYEQRALQELERRYEAETREPDGSGRSGGRTSRPPGIRVVAVLGCLCAVLLIAGAAVAAFAVAAATAIGWLFWRLWTRREDAEAVAASLLPGAAHGQSGSGRRPGESIRLYLRWLAEAE